MVRLNETVATDTFFSDVAAADDGLLGHGGCKIAQLYVGKDSLYTKVYPLRSETEMPESLEDFIRDVGAPLVLMSDNSKIQTGKQVLQLLRMFHIADGQTEPGYQEANPAERRMQNVKKTVNGCMNRTNTPACYWLLCTLFVVQLFNVLAWESLHWKTPTEAAFNVKPDCSAYLAFHWFQPVYYEALAEDVPFPDGLKELPGRWVGVCDKKGGALTHWILSDATGKVVARSNVRARVLDANLRAEAIAIYRLRYDIARYLIVNCSDWSKRAHNPLTYVGRTSRLDRVLLNSPFGLDHGDSLC